MSPKIISLTAVAAAAIFTNVSAYAQSLTGSQVTGAAYCCSSASEADRVSNLVTVTIDSAIEFPSGSFVSIDSESDIALADINFGANTLEIDYAESAITLPGGFNGYAFSFLNAPIITGVSVDPSSTYSPILSFNGNTIFVNEAGLELTPESFVLINIAAVPEPSTYAMLLGGLGIIGAARWGRKARSIVPRLRRKSRVT